ncbi:hypothetical protein D3C86_1083280 [compost metagenome]
MAVDQGQGAVLAQIAQADGRQAVGLGRALIIGERAAFLNPGNVRQGLGQVHVAALEQSFALHVDDGGGGVEDVLEARTRDDDLFDGRGLIIVPDSLLHRLAHDGQGA